MRPHRASGLGLVAAGTLGYLCGAVPSADVAARLATGGGADLRRVGSGNPGAANAMAVLGTGWGYGVLFADIAKGSLACRLGAVVAGDLGSHVGGVAAVVGHCFPWYTGFKGGKGVAASAGQCLMTFPAYFPIDLAVAGVTGMVPSWRKRAFSTTLVSSLIWIAACCVWWRRGWPNLWGPRPSGALPVAAIATSSIIAYKFVTAPPKPEPPKTEPGPPKTEPGPTIGSGPDTTEKLA